ncbi:hypothetical protein FJT64_013308 [Amphibalanus amphitrite]|uniref:Uncharacterized protein n=1 Tax=Amphibalanus amphitrite TaxID=1232801 RepID=A0A6A4VFS6_AMPAM|nr:hypothetical protein FJT64_013308 [Amphibalanus amphitrite]
MCSETHQQQCYLYMAWSVVDRDDLGDGVPMTSPVGDAVTLDVTPLTRLLFKSDLKPLLGDPAAVAAWLISPDPVKGSVRGILCDSSLYG